jgi:hypothetical protein
LNLFYNNQRKDGLRQSIQQNKIQNQIKEREKISEKLEKWNNFRKKKHLIVTKYLEAKKIRYIKLEAIKFAIVHSLKHNMMKKAYNNYVELKELKIKFPY